MWIHARGVDRIDPACTGPRRLPIIVIKGLAAQANDFRLSPRLVPLLPLESDLGDFRGPIAMNAGQVRTAMYFANQCGWTLGNAELQDEETLEWMGCGRIAIFRHTFEGNVAIPGRS